MGNAASTQSQARPSTNMATRPAPLQLTAHTQITHQQHTTPLPATPARHHAPRPPCACSHLHPHKSCLSYLVSSFGRSFYLAYGIRAGISLALHIIKLLRTRPSAVFQIDQLVGAHGLPADAVRMGLFFGGFTGIYNGMRCLLARWLGRDDVATVMGAGAIAGLAINFHPKDSHRTLALYILARVAQCWYNKAKVMRPDTLPPAYFKFIVQTGPIPLGVLDAVKTSNRGLPIDLAALQSTVNKFAGPAVAGATKRSVQDILGELATRVYGPGAPANLPPIIPCSILHPSHGVCSHQWIQTFCDAAKRSFPLYVAVTFVPMIVLRFWAVVRHPLDSLIRGSLSVAKSTTFLSSFVSLYMFLCCMQRRAFARDHRIVYWLAGFISSWTILLEQKSRRSELALYVLPRTIDSLVMTLQDRRWLSRVPHGEKIIFMIGMSCMMYYREFHPESMSPLLKRLLNFFVPTYKSLPKEAAMHEHAKEAPGTVAGRQAPELLKGGAAAPSSSSSSSSSSCAPSSSSSSRVRMPDLVRSDSDGLSCSTIHGVIPLPEAGISLSREQSSAHLSSIASLPSFITNSSAHPATPPTAATTAAELATDASKPSAAVEGAATKRSPMRTTEPASYGNLFAHDLSPTTSPRMASHSHSRMRSNSSSNGSATTSPDLVEVLVRPARSSEHMQEANHTTDDVLPVAAGEVAASAVDSAVSQESPLAPSPPVTAAAGPTEPVSAPPTTAAPTDHIHTANGGGDHHAHTGHGKKKKGRK